MAKITTIEGVGATMAARLKKAGVRSTAAMLALGATAKGRQQIARASGVDAGRILKFVNHADLMRIKGVGGEYAELLEASGVDSVPELAQRNATNLARKMAEVNASKSLVRAVPSQKRVSGWVEQAARLRRVVSH